MTRRAVVIAAALYLAATLITTWPLATVMHREIAWDLGDPVFNSWVLLWTSGQVLAFLSGDMAALSRYWHGNIFHPEPLTLAYSEHLTPQMLQALPVLAATDNVVLAYNLLFLSTFVLCGVGMFLFVRQVTGHPLAAFVAGLAFAFAPYRMAQVSHLQVLSVQWMPLVLYGYRLYFETGRRRPLVWGSAAFVVQNLSCGYYLLFFAPLVACYVLWELATRRRLGDWREWRRWLAAAAGVAVCTLPFLLPYFDLRETAQLGVRDAGEIRLFSADTHALRTPAPHLWLWGERLDGFPGPEGEGFPGFTILALALAAVATGAWRAAARMASHPHPVPVWRAVATGAVATLFIAGVAASLTYLSSGGLALPIDGVWAIHRRAGDTLLWTLLAGLALVAVSPAVQRGLRQAAGSPTVFLFVTAVLAALLAFGPVIHVSGHAVAAGPYAWLVAFVPGFDGVRVPARFFMVMALALAALAGIGWGRLWPRPGRHVTVLTAVVSAAILVEAWPGVFRTNVPMDSIGLHEPPAVLRTGDDLPDIYRHLRGTDDPVVLIEFPFGVMAWDLRAVFYAGHHQRPLVNGYSGFFPPYYEERTRIFSLVDQVPDEAWTALIDSGATHALVHESAFPDSQRGVHAHWLAAHGATEILTDGTDRLFRIR